MNRLMTQSNQTAVQPKVKTQSGLQVGQNAPHFSLIDQHNQLHQLSDYKGQWIVLYFYPRDATPICTQQACSLKEQHNALLSKHAVILGANADSVTKHQQFAQQHQLPFSLLSDTKGQVAKQYGALLDLNWLRFVKRHTFIIDPQGRIAKIYRQVNAQQHASELLGDLQQLQDLPSNSTD